MATQTRPEPHTKNFGENIESDLALEFLRVVEKPPSLRPAPWARETVR